MGFFMCEKGGIYRIWSFQESESKATANIYVQRLLLKNDDFQQTNQLSQFYLVI